MDAAGQTFDIQCWFWGLQAVLCVYTGAVRLLPSQLPQELVGNIVAHLRSEGVFPFFPSKALLSFQAQYSSYT